MRIVFFGNSEFSLRVLEKLIVHNFDFLVVTSSDKPAGRGLIKKHGHVKSFCLSKGIDFSHDDEWSEVAKKISDFKPDFYVVASYGKIIPSKILALLTRERRLNVHPSLLPRWRGPAPIQWTILSGDQKTGVSIALVDEKVDTGDIVFQKEEMVSPDDDFLTLLRLFDIAGEVLPMVMDNIAKGRAELRKQDESKATWARMIKKEDGFFTFKEDAETIHRKMRAFLVWPKIYTHIKSERVIVHKTFLLNDQKMGEGKKAGDVIHIDQKGMYVVCGEEKQSIIILSLLQREGRGILSGKDFANGMRIKVGDNILDYV